jgi:hypothetical protein
MPVIMAVHSSGNALLDRTLHGTAPSQTVVSCRVTDGREHSFYGDCAARRICPCPMIYTR